MRILLAIGVVVLVILGNVGLWTSPHVPPELKAELTRINVLAWAVVLLPAGAVALWLRAHRRDRQDRAARDDGQAPKER